ncbi:succinate dehydrogenase assembly factor 2 [soil metagenome]
MADTNARPTDTEAAHRLGRITFRAWRRGFRECDMVLGPFTDAMGASLTAEELNAFEALLGQDDDHQLYAWITGTEVAPPEHETTLMSKIRDFMRDHVAHAVNEGIG